MLQIRLLPETGGRLVGSVWQLWKNHTPRAFVELTAAIRLYNQRLLSEAQAYLGKEASKQLGILDA